MATDVTDATFQADVIERSTGRTIVVDLWAPWCGPCRTLGPVLEKVVADAGEAVELVKVNIDDNPEVAQAFRVQSIPAVFAIRDQALVDGFVGALPETQVRQWLDTVVPQPSEADRLVAIGDEPSLRAALELDPGHPAAVTALAELLVRMGDAGGAVRPEGDPAAEALALLARIPESADTRRIAALARTGAAPPDDGTSAKLDDLLGRVADDVEARQEFVDLLEVMGPDDPRTAVYRRRLTSRLF